jgi:thymidine phosphorylase
LPDLDDVARLVATRLLELAAIEDAPARIERALASDAALEQLEAMVAAQTGDYVAAGDPLVVVHGRDPGHVRHLLGRAYIVA